ncbi:CAAX prenyl protease 1 like protein [Cucumispora dikerogammari]|nr:CAAX prenyl protease 1 like protein [Cucumispora dikerogammari]
MLTLLKKSIIKQTATLFSFIKDITTIKTFNKRAIEKIIIIGEIINCIFTNYLKIRQLKAVRKNTKQEVKLYQTDTLLFSIIKNVTLSIITVIVLYNNIYDTFYYVLKRHFKYFNENVFTTFFILLVVNIGTLVDLPFKIVSQFGIEAIHGFNKSTVFLFVTDLIKSFTISNILMGILFYVIVVFLAFKNLAFYIFGFLFVFQLFLLAIVPTYILPLFNKFSELENQELKTEIDNLAIKTNFPLTEIKVMNQSIRSAKSNAFFAGFGNNKRIVLFDTLLTQIVKNEPLVAVLAHEIGHWKYNHLWKSFALLSINQFISLLSFQVFYNSSFINVLYENNVVLKMLHFYYLLGLLTVITNIMNNVHSRKNEKEADKFAVEMKFGGPLKEGLNLLLSSNKSSEHDDWLYSYINYSHPTVKERVVFIDRETELMSKKVD